MVIKVVEDAILIDFVCLSHIRLICLLSACWCMSFVCSVLDLPVSSRRCAKAVVTARHEFGVASMR